MTMHTRSSEKQGTMQATPVKPLALLCVVVLERDALLAVPPAPEPTCSTAPTPYGPAPRRRCSHGNPAHDEPRVGAARAARAARAGPSAEALPEARAAAPASEAAGRRGLRLARRGGPLEGQAERVAVGVVVLRAHARALGRVHHDVVPARQGGVGAGAKPYPGRRARGGGTLPCPGAQHVSVCCRLLCWCW